MIVQADAAPGDADPGDADPGVANPGDAASSAGAGAGATPAGPAPGDIVASDAAWDAFVAGGLPGSYLQLSHWARVKAPNGWASTRIAAPVAGAAATGGAPDRRLAAQILVRRPRGLPWAFAYAPRGPVGSDRRCWDADALSSFTDACRAGLGGPVGRVSHLRIDPEIERDGDLDPAGRLRTALERLGWRPAPYIQPETTRLIDLRAEEAALWGDLRKKWRQYVNRARGAGVVVEDDDGSRLGEFYRIYRETASRAGFHIRTEAAYRDVWQAYRPSGAARLLFAVDGDGTPQATLMLIRCGARVVEPYGGMTAFGAETRANYLLKWEAIRSSREQGAATYDLWGLAHPGIAHFKAGFGGREVRYVGAWDLVLDRLGREAFDKGTRARAWWARRRLGGRAADVPAPQGAD